MLYANTLTGSKAQATPGTKGVCPFCGSGVIAKCGEINIWHWAHERSSECDMWSEGETEWHLEWKSNFLANYAEIQIIKQDQKHIADICFPNGVVIEFQHSPISVQEIRERENFYKKMIWVFDIAYTVNWEFWRDLNKGILDYPDSSNFDMRPQAGNLINDTACTFRWKHARKSIAYARSPVYLDIGNDKLFQLTKMYPDIPTGGKGFIRSKTDFIEKLHQGNS